MQSCEWPVRLKSGVLTLRVLPLCGEIMLASVDTTLANSWHSIATDWQDRTDGPVFTSPCDLLTTRLQLTCCLQQITQFVFHSWSLSDSSHESTSTFHSISNLNYTLVVICDLLWLNLPHLPSLLFPVNKRLLDMTFSVFSPPFLCFLFTAVCGPGARLTPWCLLRWQR